MRLEQLHYLITLSKSPSISSASQKLFLTPSALSTAIKNLERELGITLVNRTHTGVSLTDAGKRIVKSAQRFFLDIDHIVKEATPEAASAATGSIHFYASQGALDTILPRIMCLFYQDYPLISITATQAANKEMFSLVKEHQQEFALLYIVPGQNLQGLTFTPLFSCQLLLKLNPANPLARYKSIAFKTLKDQTVVVYATSEINATFCNKLFEKYGHPHKVIYEQNAKVCEEMITSGLAIGLSLEMPLQSPPLVDGHFTHVRLKDIPKFEFGYILNPEIPLTLLSKIFLNHMIAYLNENIDPAYLLC